MSFFSKVLVLILISFSAVAQKYQRQKVLPNYFIPAQDITYQEILEKQQRPQATPSKISSKENTNPEPKPSTSQELPQNYHDNPEFMQIFDEYRKDIDQISKTNQYPNTSQIKSDYQGMNTNNEFLVE